MSYDTEELETALEQVGELIVVLDSDAYPDNIELHLHDTQFDHEGEQVILELADGQIQFKADSVESAATHLQTTDELGL